MFLGVQVSNLVVCVLHICNYNCKSPRAQLYQIWLNSYLHIIKLICDLWPPVSINYLLDIQVSFFTLLWSYLKHFIQKDIQFYKIWSYFKKTVSGVQHFSLTPMLNELTVYRDSLKILNPKFGERSITV